MSRLSSQIQTPWGTADAATEYAPGITFYETPSHGGFCLSPARNAEVLAKFPGFRTFSGAVGWYEEDCDWSAVALTFPHLFSKPGLLAEAQACFDGFCAKRMPSPALTAHVSPEVAAAFGLDKLAAVAPHLVKIDLPNEEGRDWICTGNFDGFTCGSDADSGL